MNLLKPSSKEQALKILQQGLAVQPGSFNEVFPQSEDGRMSFNENSKRRAHPRVPNIFDRPVKEQFTPPPLFSMKSAKQQSKQLIQIPELPSGRIIDIKILSNWGDKSHYGLNGIELFDSSGGNITRYVRIPPQEDYGQKLRLVDGFQAIQDENHMFLVGKPPKIRIDLTAKLRLSLIRIWNYNKSRIHSYKGVRKIQIYMDDNIMFQGDIRKASGDLKRFQDNCEYILFTEDERIIKKINDNDWLNQRALDYSVQILKTTINFDRPNTGQKQELSTQPDTQNTQYPYVELYDIKFEFNHTSSFCIGAIQIFDNFGELVPINLNMNIDQLFNGQIVNLPFQNKKQSIHIKFDQLNKISFIRFYQHQNGPQTMKLSFLGKSQIIYLRPTSYQKEDYQTIFLTNLQKLPDLKIPIQMHMGLLVTINLVSTWGDTHYIGLNGLEIYNEQGQAVLFRNLASHKIMAVPELKGDARVVKNLCRPPYGKDCQPQQSFLAPFMNTPHEWLICKQEQLLNEKFERTDINKIHVLFEHYVAISQIDFFNYSKNPDRGVKEVHIYINMKIVFQGYLRRFDTTNNKTSVVFYPLQKLQPSIYQVEQNRVQCINEGKALYVEKKMNYEMSRPGTCAR